MKIEGMLVMLGNGQSFIYPRWRQAYANEAFDRIQALALKLTERDREAGRKAPAAGYSRENIERATRVVQEAQA